MSSPSRVFAILDLFTEENPVWQPDNINTALGYSRPTGYRYVKELVEAGLLQKISAGNYALGGRIIALDYLLRKTDPILVAADPIMRELAAHTKFDTALSVMFAGPQVIDVHRVNAEKNLHLSYGRGRPRPLFLAASPKVLLANMPRNSLRRLYETHAKEISINGMGNNWQDFLSVLTKIRKDGFYYSQGELEPGLGAVAAPIFNPEGDCVAALAVVGSIQRFETGLDTSTLKKLQEASAAIRISLG
jgi:DNA-binding IclR family transcriptional regulator